MHMMAGASGELGSNALSANARNFPSFLTLLRVDCLLKGKDVMYGRDPITSHLCDIITEERITTLSHAESEAWSKEAAAFGEQQIRDNPALITSALSALLRHKIFYFDKNVEFDFSLIKDDYESLERECAEWIVRESEKCMCCLSRGLGAT